MQASAGDRSQNISWQPDRSWWDSTIPRRPDSARCGVFPRPPGWSTAGDRAELSPDGHQDPFYRRVRRARPRGRLQARVEAGVEPRFLMTTGSLGQFSSGGRRSMSSRRRPARSASIGSRHRRRSARRPSRVSSSWNCAVIPSRVPSSRPPDRGVQSPEPRLRSRTDARYSTTRPAPAGRRRCSPSPAAARRASSDAGTVSVP